MENARQYKAVVIGTSSGGMNVLKVLLPSLPRTFSMPLIIVQHIGASSDGHWIEMLDELCQLRVKEANEKEKIEKGIVYIAPPNYHLLTEKNKTFSLSVDDKVNYARPSIDVLFESAALTYTEGLVGILLTGANEDGAFGMKKIKEYGGLTIAEDPKTAESSFMPAAAIATTKVDHILPIQEIRSLLKKL